MSELTVRKSTKEDCGSLLTMIKELAVFHKESEDEVKINEKNLVEEGFGENPWYHCLIAECTAEEDTKAVGFVIYYKAYSTWHGKAFFVEDIYVRDVYRTQGVGTMLFEEITSHVLQEGGNKVSWSALDWNKPAHKFYKKCGAEMSDDWRTFTFKRNAMENFLKN